MGSCVGVNFCVFWASLFPLERVHSLLPSNDKTEATSGIRSLQQLGAAQLQGHTIWRSWARLVQPVEISVDIVDCRVFAIRTPRRTAVVILLKILV